MAITVKCGGCDRTLEAPDDKAGMSAKCPNCGIIVTVPKISTPREPVINRDGIKKGLAIAALCGFIGTIGVKPSLWVPLHYACLFTAAFITGTMIKIRRSKLIGMAAAIVCVVVWSQFDSYVEHWTGEVTEYTDQKMRMSGQIYHRKATNDRVHGSGPMAGDPVKMHGHWVFYFKPEQRRIDQWYWYGDEVSQGEWELRQKK
jgi:DNA-directed RNA polymerase subunit RPC12/RpoP